MSPSHRVAIVVGMLLAIGGTIMAAERVPEAAVVGGVPQGMFVSRSLLTGRSVCLLFLSGGRVTRAIPEGGLENFDWKKHQAEHSGDSGRWETRGGQIAIAFTPDSGATTAHTLLAVSGSPITAFSVDASMYTRVP